MTRGVVNNRVQWEVFDDCPKCGAREGTACFRSNGSRARQACMSRPFTPDGGRVIVADLSAKVDSFASAIADMRELILKQQRQIDVLLGELE